MAVAARGRGLAVIVSLSVSVISGHSAVLEGLREGAERVGGELVIDESQTLNHRLTLMAKARGGESEKLLLCSNEKDFFGNG